MATPFTYSIQGASGYSGVQGPQGAQGITGAQGAQGAQGATGPQGFTGLQGAQGTQGAQGAQGVAGGNGSSGYSGFSGAFAGTGTTNYVPKFTGASSLGNSLIYDNGTNVGISTTNPNTTLTVNGSISANSSNHYFTGSGGTTLYLQTAGVNNGYIQAGGGAGTDISFLTGRSFNFATNNGAQTPFQISITGGVSVGYPNTLNMYSVPASGLIVSGSVGVGVSGPSQALEVSSGANYQMRIGAGGANAGYTYDIGRNGGTGYLNFYGNQSGYNGYVFGGADRTMMTILNNGNVGIGLTAPNTSRLHVTDSVSYSTMTSGYYANMASFESASNAAGISIISTPYTGNNSCFINYLVGGNDIGYNLGWKVGAFADSTGAGGSRSFRFYQISTSGTYSNLVSAECMRIVQSGQVGIGTTSPGTKLTVYDGSNTYSAAFGGNGGTQVVVLGNSGGTGTVSAYTSGFGSPTTLSLNPAGGNVGIGTTAPNQALTVSGSLSATGTIYQGSAPVATFGKAVAAAIIFS